MVTIQQVLADKGRQVWSIHSTTTVFDALRLMAEKEIGALLVIDDGDLRGIVSERDYARKVILAGRSSRETAVSEIMSSPVIHATAEQLVPDAMAMMTERRIRHLPITENGNVIGIISIGDLVKAIIADQQALIGQLENYISGAVA